MVIRKSGKRDGPSRLRVVAPTPLRNQVANRLRKAIADGCFRPGERLIERALCEMTAVSRTSVREALRQLEAEGLVVTVPNRGPIVALIDQKDAGEIYEARAVLEGLAAQLFARRASIQQLRMLETAFDQLASACRSSNASRYLAVKARFYGALMDGADNRIVADLLRSIHTRVNQLRATSLLLPGRVDKSLSEIRAIVEALQARDEDAAWRCSVEHVRRAAQAALVVLSGKNQSQTVREEANGQRNI